MGALSTQITVLLSGGIDSAAVLAHHRESGPAAPLRAVFFDYKQPALRSEWAAARAIARHYHVPVRKLRLAVRMARRRGEYLGRNGLFILTAAAWLGWRPGVLALGIHEGHFYDTTPAFVADLQRVLDGYTAGTMLISAPFAGASKAEIIQWAQRRRVPLHLTYSCLRRERPACGRCASCQEREAIDDR